MYVGQILGHGFQHVATLGYGEQRILLRIAQDRDDQFIEDLCPAMNEVEVPVRDRVKRSGIDGYDSLQGLSNSGETLILSLSLRSKQRNRAQIQGKSFAGWLWRTIQPATLRWTSAPNP